jgi:pSer/pThr/pTyr-binding forkhead associated (FHA) protein
MVMIILKLQLNDGNFRSFEFMNRKSITIGRWKTNDIVLTDPTVSGHHAAIEMEEEVFCIKDLESRNGSRVNDIHVTHQTLKSGDVIKLGNTVIEYVNEDLETKFDELESRRSPKTKLIDTSDI